MRRAAIRWLCSRLTIVLLFVPCTPGMAADPPQLADQALSIYDVEVLKTSFNPSMGESVALEFQLTRSADVTVKVFDPDQALVRTLADDESMEPGAQRIVWDGQDLDGRIVPDEAYFFTVEAETSDERAVYDPITFSGGEPYDLSDAEFDRTSGSLVYQLPAPSRVLVRIGLSGSALLRTLVDWEPRPGGAITEYWNGKDADNLIDLWEREFSVVITYFLLPETSVITYGNTGIDYLAYKEEVMDERPNKVDREMVSNRQVSPHFTLPRRVDRAVAVELSFPGANPDENGIPVAADVIVLRIDVPPKDKALLADQQYEVIAFVDTIFYAEEERGYLPMNMPIELAQLPEGLHLATINIATFDGQFGVSSARFRVKR